MRCVCRVKLLETQLHFDGLNDAKKETYNIAVLTVTLDAWLK
jgi:hypothetical protein